MEEPRIQRSKRRRGQCTRGKPNNWKHEKKPKKKTKYAQNIHKLLNRQAMTRHNGHRWKLKHCVAGRWNMKSEQTFQQEPQIKNKRTRGCCASRGANTLKLSQRRAKHKQTLQRGGEKRNVGHCKNTRMCHGVKYVHNTVGLCDFVSHLFSKIRIFFWTNVHRKKQIIKHSAPLQMKISKCEYVRQKKNKQNT